MRIDPSRRRFAQGSLALGLMPWLAACGSDDDAPLEQQYTRTVQQAMARYFLPGVLAAVRVPGRTQWNGVFGKADLAANTPLSWDSTFPIRSVTKSFTVTLVLQLVREGVLALDHSLERYVAGAPNGQLITLADLAGMQSGLVDYSAQDGFLDLFIADPQRVWTERELVDFSFAVTPPFLPGAAYQYSNTNTVLLGMVVQAVSHQPLADVMRERIYVPLGMPGSAYPSGVALPPPFPTPYVVELPTGETSVAPQISPTSLAGSGAMTSTLADLLTWGDELGSGSLIGSTLRDLRRSRSRPVTNGPEYERYGLGIGEIDGWWGHTGSGLGYQLAVMNDPASGATIAVMVNATPAGARRDLNFAQELFEELAEVALQG